MPIIDTQDVGTAGDEKLIISDASSESAAEKEVDDHCEEHGWLRTERPVLFNSREHGQVYRCGARVLATRPNGSPKMIRTGGETETDQEDKKDDGGA